MTTVGDGLYQYGGMPIGPLGIGNIYYVYDTTSTSAPDMVSRYGKSRYKDGSSLLYAHTATSGTVTTDGLTAALAVTVADRNDYVVVSPGTYYIDALISMTKRAVHLVCPAGMGYDIGAVRAATIQQTGTYACIGVTAYAVEISGLAFKNKATYSTVTLTASAMGPNIHHNTFYLVWEGGTNAPALMGSTSGGAWGSIERNWFITMQGNGDVCAAVLLINAQATGCRVSNNEMTIGNTQTVTLGIANDAALGTTNFNLFSDCGSSTASSGTIANCIKINSSPGCASATGNLAAVDAGAIMTGGVTSHSFCENYPAWSTGTGAENGSVES